MEERYWDLYSTYTQRPDGRWVGEVVPRDPRYETLRAEATSRDDAKRKILVAFLHKLSEAGSPEEEERLVRAYAEGSLLPKARPDH